MSDNPDINVKSMKYFRKTRFGVLFYLRKNKIMRRDVSACPLAWKRHNLSLAGFT